MPYLIYKHITSMYVERFLCLLFSKTRRVSCRKEDLPTLSEHLRSPQFFGVRVSHQFLVFYVQCLFLSFCVLHVPEFVFVHGFPFVLNCTSVVFPLLFSRLDFEEFVFLSQLFGISCFYINILFCSFVFVFCFPYFISFFYCFLNYYFI